MEVLKVVVIDKEEDLKIKEIGIRKKVILMEVLEAKNVVVVVIKTIMKKMNGRINSTIKRKQMCGEMTYYFSMHIIKIIRIILRNILGQNIQKDRMKKIMILQLENQKAKKKQKNLRKNKQKNWRLKKK